MILLEVPLAAVVAICDMTTEFVPENETMVADAPTPVPVKNWPTNNPAVMETAVIVALLAVSVPTNEVDKLAPEGSLMLTTLDVALTLPKKFTDCVRFPKILTPLTVVPAVGV